MDSSFPNSLVSSDLFFHSQIIHIHILDLIPFSIPHRISTTKPSWYQSQRTLERGSCRVDIISFSLDLSNNYGAASSISFLFLRRQNLVLFLTQCSHNFIHLVLLVPTFVVPFFLIFLSIWLHQVCDIHSIYTMVTNTQLFYFTVCFSVLSFCSPFITILSL